MSDKSVCDYCHSELPLSEKRVTAYRKRRGQVFVLENVPARVCQLAVNATSRQMWFKRWRN